MKIQGIIGPCASLDKNGALCSDTVIGQGNATAWKMCGLDKGTSLCIFFDVRKEVSGVGGQSSSNQFIFQYLTYYQHNSRQMCLKSTTLSKRWVDGPGSREELADGFD